MVIQVSNPSGGTDFGWQKKQLFAVLALSIDVGTKV